VPCAGDSADATREEVSLDPAPEQADVNAPSEQAAVDEPCTVDVVSEPSVAETNPALIEHDVVVAIVALAEAEKSSAPDMPAKHASQKVRASIQRLH
jgi:hypothetical protein